MNDNDYVAEGAGALIAIIGIIALFIFAPMISFFLSYFGGWICKITFGDTLCSALNTLFNVSFFTPDKLPMMAGALGWVGGYFKTTKIDFNKKKSR